MERGEREKRGIEELRVRVDEVLGGLEEDLNRDGEADRVGGGTGSEASRSGHQDTEDTKVEAEKRMWEFLMEEVGS